MTEFRVTIPETPGGIRHLGRVLVRWAASLKLTIVLLVLLAAVLGWGAFLEKAKGLECAEWYVYRSAWFIGLLGVLAANMVAATLPAAPAWRNKGRSSCLSDCWCCWPVSF